MKTYDTYKHSGIDWLGKIPSHWKVKKVTHLFSKIGSGTTPTSGLAQYYENGSINFLQTGDLNDNLITYTSKKITKKALRDSSSLKIYPKGSLVIAMYGATIGKLGILDIETATNQACCVLGDNNKSLVIKYFFYWFSFAKQQIISMSYGGGQPNISQDLIKSLRLQFPPIHEQEAIAAFLDEKCGKIDALVEIKSQQIEKLKELRQVKIHQAVTKGLDANVALKDSGIDWIGEIPKHWEVKKVKEIFKLIIEPSPKDNVYELLSVYTDIGVKPRKELEEKGNKASTTDGYWIVKKGDIIVNKLLAWMGAIGISNYDGVTSPAYDILRNKIPIIGLYYHNLFRMKSTSSELKRHSRGIMEMRLRLYFEKFGQILVPYPPVKEQEAIVAYLDDVTGKIDQAIAQKQEQIEKLKQYKQSLINEVVTGKVRVC